jgi:hypothetical protein
VEVSGERKTPAALPQERYPEPIEGDWMGPRAGQEVLGGEKNLMPLPRFEQQDITP